MGSEQPGTGPRGPESYAWPLIALAVVILPQVIIPTADRIGPPTIVPLIEGLAFVCMLVIAAKPGPVPRGAEPAVLSLFGIMAGANGAAAVRLVILTLRNGKVDGAEITASRLLTAGTLVLATNVVTFALLYWQIDGGGPARRVTDPARYPDFEFPQHATTGLAPADWRPHFADHLYLAYTNIVAFSPTDTMPLTRRAKGLMAVQSLISLGVLVVVLARVINILPA
jgi:uncharacterized membrane protein